MYYAIGTLMVFITIFGITENFAILYTYLKNRKIRTVDNLFIVGISLSDIGQAIFGVPLVVIASFNKSWIFGFGVCQYYAFVTTFLGISQVAMLTLLAVERYFIIVKCHRKLSKSYRRGVATIVFSFLYGIGWATGPLVGWSSYEVESEGIACSVSWEITEPISFSYTISLFTFGWFIPLILIVFGYLSIAWTIYMERLRKSTLRHTTKRHHSRDKKIAVTLLLMIGAFVTSWLPYSVVSMWSAVGKFKDIPVWTHVAPAVFAKCSIIWNPIIYVARHSMFRKAVIETIVCCKQSTLPGFVNKTRTEGRPGKIRNAIIIKSKIKYTGDNKGSSESLESFTSDNNNSCQDETACGMVNSNNTELSIYSKQQVYKRQISILQTYCDDSGEFLPMMMLTKKKQHKLINGENLSTELSGDIDNL